MFSLYFIGMATSCIETNKYEKCGRKRSIETNVTFESRRYNVMHRIYLRPSRHIPNNRFEGLQSNDFGEDNEIYMCEAGDCTQSEYYVMK